MTMRSAVQIKKPCPYFHGNCDISFPFSLSSFVEKDFKGSLRRNKIAFMPWTLTLAPLSRTSNTNIENSVKALQHNV